MALGLAGKMFTFPKETGSSHVKIITPNLDLTAATVCLRFFTDITGEYTLLSVATADQPCALQLTANRRINSAQPFNDIYFFVNGQLVIFHGHSIKVNTWQSICVTWDSNTGLSQLWLNGKPSTRKITSTSHLTGDFTVVLGQELTSLKDHYYGGKKPFVGMMSDLQMWDYELTPDQIQMYTFKGTFSNGNILNWASLDFEVKDCVLIEDEQKF